MPCVDVSTSNMEETWKKLHIFGKNDKTNLTPYPPYQCCTNKACEELSPLNRLGWKSTMMDMHTKKDIPVHSSTVMLLLVKPNVWNFAKMRDQRIVDISEQMSDFDWLIRIKERIEEATTTRSFAAADQLAKEVRTYKQERVQLRM